MLRSVVHHKKIIFVWIKNKITFLQIHTMPLYQSIQLRRAISLHI